MPTTPGPDAGRVPAAIRRAVLPWYRKTPSSRRFLYVPWWPKRVLHIPVLNLLFLLVTFPLWIWLVIPPLIAWSATIIEGLLALVLCPLALVFRRLRHAWPVEVIDWRAKVMERSYHRTWADAGAHAQALRETHRWTTHTTDVGSFTTRDELRGGGPQDSGLSTIGDAIDLGLDLF